MLCTNEGYYALVVAKRDPSIGLGSDVDAYLSELFLVRMQSLGITFPFSLFVSLDAAIFLGIFHIKNFFLDPPRILVVSYQCVSIMRKHKQCCRGIDKTCPLNAKIRHLVNNQGFQDQY